MEDKMAEIASRGMAPLVVAWRVDVFAGIRVHRAPKIARSPDFWDLHRVTLPRRLGRPRAKKISEKVRRVTPYAPSRLCSVSMPRAPSPYPCDFTPLSLTDALDAACCSVFVLRWA